MFPTILCCGGNVFTEFLPSRDTGIRRPTDTRVQNFFCLLRVYSVQQERVYLAVA
jgi:hypothetical protein